jgi:hypothetical protein
MQAKDSVAKAHCSLAPIFEFARDGLMGVLTARESRIP